MANKGASSSKTETETRETTTDISTLKTNKIKNAEDSNEIINSKRPKIQLSTNKKVACLTALINGYERLFNLIVNDKELVNTCGQNVSFHNNSRRDRLF